MDLTRRVGVRRGLFRPPGGVPGGGGGRQYGRGLCQLFRGSRRPGGPGETEGPRIRGIRAGDLPGPWPGRYTGDRHCSQECGAHDPQRDCPGGPGAACSQCADPGSAGSGAAGSGKAHGKPL